MTMKKFKDNYFVTTCGKVWSYRSNRFLTPKTNTSGYQQVDLYDNGERHTICVHKLVAMWYVDNLCDKDQVNHIDGNKSHNWVGNLEWVTCGENISHAYNIGLYRSRDGGMSKSVVSINVESGLISIFDSMMEASRITGVSNKSISAVCNGTRNTIYGHKWRLYNEQKIQG